MPATSRMLRTSTNIVLTCTTNGGLWLKIDLILTFIIATQVVTHLVTRQEEEDKGFIL